MRCASCGYENPAEMSFCEECGSKLVPACPSCGHAVRPAAKFCGKCGTALAEHARSIDLAPPVPRAPGSALSGPSGTAHGRPDAERRQLTVLFCDLVDSTALAAQLDPEEWREVVRTYQEACARVIGRYEGHIAQYLGDGLLVYFGYPVAHEDDAVRAVRAGLAIVEALQALNSRLAHPVRVRIGVHTGLVVVGEVGGGGKWEQLAVGETPNIAARLQSLAEPGTVVISGATERLVQGLFECQDYGPQRVRGLSTPLAVYRVLGESGARSRFDVGVSRGLTPLVGREHEVTLLLERWERTKQGEGQVVLLSGEPGIGKSRLAQVLRERVEKDGATLIEFRCSAYSQNSTFFPVIEHLRRVLRFERADSPQTRLDKLTQTISRYHFPRAETVPLLAALLSLPQPDDAPPLSMSPQRQKQKTREALIAWLLEEAGRAPVCCAWEDLHWADASTLELLGLLIEQVPAARLCLLLTARPEFAAPWGARAQLSQLTLGRLGRGQVEAMVGEVPGGKALPREVLRQVVAKADGVPLFVEELTKAAVESVESLGAHDPSALQALAVPATLHDSLMARLDRLGTVKEVAQLGATLGREFSYELMRAVSPLDEVTLRHGLRQLVEVELVYQRGPVPQAYYRFKHALVQDAAYQSLLKSTRQQYHRQIARVLEEEFPETKEAQPELLAHHYTEAGLSALAIPYWQQAGERARQRSAYVEATSHLTKGLEVLKSLPDTPARAQQELTLQLALSSVLMAVKGYTAPEVEKLVLRAQELCQQLGETPQLFPVRYRLWTFYFLRGELQTAHELAEQMMCLGQSTQDRYLLSMAHLARGWTVYQRGELPAARIHAEQVLALCDPQTRPRSAVNALDQRVDCLAYATWAVWLLGYPDQALKKSQEALALAEGLAHSFSLAYALGSAALLHALRREEKLARERAEAVMALSTEQGFPFWLAWGTMVQGWALAQQGQVHEGIARMRHMRAPFTFALLAEAYGKEGQVEEGLTVLAEALAFVERTGIRVSEAELYRLKGELTLQEGARDWGLGAGSSSPNTQHLAPRTQAQAEAEAEVCFQQAIEIARRQQAKSLELRAVMSLARLWQQQGKKEGARQILSEIYGWFTEGFDTKDLQEAKALLEKLGEQQPGGQG